MTHASEAIPSSGHNLGSIWGSFWDTDRTQWQWQAPTPRATSQDKGAAALPSWLMEWDTTSQEKMAESVDAEITNGRPIEKPVRVEEDIRRYRAMIKKATGKNNITKLSLDFAVQFRKSLTLGLVSEKTLDYTLRHVPKDIRAAYPNEKLTSYLCLAFFTDVWEGIAASKVIGPSDIDAKVMNRLFSLVVSLPIAQGMLGLAHKILHSTSDIQLRHMARGITFLVKKWSESWLADWEARERGEEMRSAESLVTTAEERVAGAQTLVMALKQGPDYDKGLAMAQEALSDAHTAVSIAIDATVQAEDIVSPLEASTNALAQALEKLPRDLVLNLVRYYSRRIMAVGGRKEQSHWSFYYRWLYVVARMSNVDDQLLVQIWRQVDPSNHLSTTKCSVIILNQWISQGKVKKAPAVRNTFAASLLWPLAGQSASFARLLLALDKHRELCFTRAGELFELLHSLGRHQHIPDILFRMNELDMKIPTTMLGAAVEKMSAHDIKRALDMYYLPHDMKLGYPLRPEFMPKFVIAQINDPSVPPAAIWKLLNIPIYEGGSSFQPYFAKPLPREMIDLIHKMATAFARSEGRPCRVAFRNILQCLHHLRIHNAPISPELTRAVSHANITRSILNGLSVGQERLRYALHLVAKVEGEEVAKAVDETVFKWRQYVHEKRTKARREANVLSTGPIE